MAIYVPSIAAPYLLKEIDKRLVIGKLADNITDDVPDIEWQGSAITFPTYTRVAVASVVEAKGSVTANEISGDSTSATINHIAAAVKWHQDTLRTSGRVLANMGLKDLADAMALKLDADLTTTAYENATLKSATAAADAITQTEVENALALFGDKQNADEFSGILINSKLFSSFLGMDAFTSESKTYTTSGAGIVTGQIVGFYRGIPVRLTDNANRPTVSGTAECKTIVLKKGGLAYALKKAIEFVEQYNNTTFYTTVTADTYAAQKVVDTSKVAVIAKTIA